MSEERVVKSTCGLCYGGCGVLVALEGDRVVNIKGDPDSPINQGKLCAKGLASIDYLYHPDRLKHPIKREGERGEGRWKRISWHEALDTIANEFHEVKEKYGPESVAMIHGSAKGIQDSFLVRLANAYGTPNVATQGQACHVPRLYSSHMTFGFMPVHDLEFPPKCIVVWGYNPANTFHYVHRKILQAVEHGSKLIVIDPRETPLARRADLWLRIRPGSDLALALGMINVMIQENLFDQPFVASWTIGFDQLRTHVRKYPLEKVEALTWVDTTTIREATRLYAGCKPACIAWGNALDHNVYSFQAGRALSILMAITGNLEIPGGEVLPVSTPVEGRRSPRLELKDNLPTSVREKRVDAEHGLLPQYPYVIPQSVIKAILDGDPYPIHMAYVQGCNPLITYSHAGETYRALNRLDFLAVADRFMTPTASLADIVLPSASYLEYDSIVKTPINGVTQVQQKVAQIGECRSDYDILKDIAYRLGLEDHFWDTEEQCLDALLEPAGRTFREFKEVGSIAGEKAYRQFEKTGFPTPSGKVEIYSNQLKENGFDPLPEFHELPDIDPRDPEHTNEYPLVLTSWKLAPFQHSGGRQIDTLRKMNREPRVHIHPATAAKLGIRDGDQVFIETSRGRIKQKASLTDALAPTVVGVEYGWWFPEKEPDKSYGWAESNVNILTDDRPPYSPEIGSSNLRGIMCKVYK